MVAYYEAQSKNPPAKKLVLFAQVLKVSIDELLGAKQLKIQEPQNSRFWKRLHVFNKLPVNAQKKVVELAELLAKNMEHQNEK